MLGLLRTAVDEFGQTVVMVTHDPEAASLRRPPGGAARRARGARRRRRQRRGGHRADEGRGVTKVALRGIGARKLRAFTTWLAIFLGRRAGRRHVRPHRHDQQVVRARSSPSRSRAPTSRSPRARTSRRTTRSPPAFPARLLDRGARRSTACEAAAGSVFASGRFVDAKGDPIGNSFAPELHLVAACRRASSRSTTSRAASRARPTRRRSTRRPPTRAT